MNPVVVVDTREQLPYSFPESWPVVKKALKSGDYSVLGHEETFAIERKSLSDLLGCIFQDRFHRELQRLSEFKRAFLVIESSIWKIKNNRHYKGNVNSVIGMLQAIPLKYGVNVLLLDDRETAESFAKGLIEKYCKYTMKEAESGAGS